MPYFGKKLTCGGKPFDPPNGGGIWGGGIPNFPKCGGGRGGSTKRCSCSGSSKKTYN